MGSERNQKRLSCSGFEGTFGSEECEVCVGYQSIVVTGSKLVFLFLPRAPCRLFLAAAFLALSPYVISPADSAMASPSNLE